MGWIFFFHCYLVYFFTKYKRFKEFSFQGIFCVCRFCWDAEVAKSVEVLKDLVTTRKSERTDKELTKSKSKDEKDKAKKHGVPWFFENKISRYGRDTIGGMLPLKDCLTKGEKYQEI